MSVSLMKAFPVFMSQWKNHYWQKPEYREQHNNVYLTLRNRVTAHEKNGIYSHYAAD
ncbi:transcriptional regulator containing an hth domain [Haemophilus influenzae]|uniref:Transcriptional regulator containing an hth domain n=1 Tax=Haemophilus influenzae TaxID=727 RepID=A0A2X1QL92_HAEIF|nr:transcriptional regulator containing an hth domain [Haemophilus influenzae]